MVLEAKIFFWFRIIVPGRGHEGTLASGSILVLDLGSGYMDVLTL